jgi:hypothetical protein
VNPVPRQIIANLQLSLADIHHGILRSNGRLPAGRGFAGLFGYGGGGGGGGVGEMQFDPRLDTEKAALILPAAEPLSHFALGTLCVGAQRIEVFDGATVRHRLARAAAVFLGRHVVLETNPPAVRLPHVFSAFQVPSDINLK